MRITIPKFFKNNPQKGFTMMELLIIISLVGFLSGLGLTTGKNQLDKGFDSKRKGDLKKISEVLEHYNNDHGCYPTQTEWDAADCNSNPSFYSSYMNKFPCDPTLKTKYIYQTTDASGNTCTGDCGDCPGYRLMAVLSNKYDTDILQAGCDPKEGCGVTGPQGEIPNFGLAMGSSVPVPGFVPGQGENVGHTDKHDCQHSKDPECVSPTPTATITITPTPTPENNYCLEMPNPTPTPRPIYPAGANNYYYSPGYPPIGIDNIPADFFDLTRALEWYKVEHGGNYPDCSCNGWAQIDVCLKNNLSKYIVSYPNDILLRQISWTDMKKYDIRYISFNNNSDFCLATTWAWGINPSTPWNQQCPVGIPSDSYIWLIKGHENIINRRPIFANVYSLLPSNEGSQRDIVRKQQLIDIKNALEQYKKDNGHYPFTQNSRINSAYNLSSFRFYLVPKYLPIWTDDPYNTNTEPHKYDIWYRDLDTNGYPLKYCLMAYMDENTNCQNSCPDFPWIYHHGEAFCYYLQND